MSTPPNSLPDRWQERPMGDLLAFRNGINADKSAYGSGVPFANVLEVITHDALNTEQIPGRITVTPKVLKRYEVKYGDVLLNRTSETQEEVGLTSVYLGDEPIVFGGFVFRGRPITDELAVSFSKYAFRSPVVRRQIVAGGQGGIRSNIGQRDLKSVLVPVPPRPEQESIAEVLDDSGRLVSQLERLVAKKRDVKQGLMQELLTGRSRLPGCTRPWRSRALGEIATITMGQSPPGVSYNTSGVGTPLIQGNADVDGRRTFDRVWTTDPTKRVRAGDVVLTVRAPVGYTAVASSDACLGRGVCGLSAGPSSSFLFHALVGAEPSWSVLEQGSTFTAVNTSQVRTFAVSWPDDLDERSAIADVLADADRELDALERRLAKARAIKHGMMQELLTGQTRLPAAGAAA